MHTIQQETIKLYRSKYPKHTLRQIGANTGIQTTRVFRILNGYEMKLGEYLAFQKVLYPKLEAPSRSKNLQYINEHFFSVDEQTAKDLKEKLEYSIALNRLTNLNPNITKIQ